MKVGEYYYYKDGSSDFIFLVTRIEEDYKVWGPSLDAGCTKITREMWVLNTTQTGILPATSGQITLINKALGLNTTYEIY